MNIQSRLAKLEKRVVPEKGLIDFIFVMLHNMDGGKTLSLVTSMARHETIKISDTDCTTTEEFLSYLSGLWNVDVAAHFQKERK